MCGCVGVGGDDCLNGGRALLVRLFSSGERTMPVLSEAPEWMVDELQRRTGRDSAECRRMLVSATPEEYQALYGEWEDIRVDPIEADPAFAAILLRASLETEREIGSVVYEGYCFVFWDCKKRILRKKYGVKWQDPAELNPDVDFD